MATAGGEPRWRACWPPGGELGAGGALCARPPRPAPPFVCRRATPLLALVPPCFAPRKHPPANRGIPPAPATPPPHQETPRAHQGPTKGPPRAHQDPHQGLGPPLVGGCILAHFYLISDPRVCRRAKAGADRCEVVHTRRGIAKKSPARLAPGRGVGLSRTWRAGRRRGRRLPRLAPHSGPGRRRGPAARGGVSGHCWPLTPCPTGTPVSFHFRRWASDASSRRRWRRSW